MICAKLSQPENARHPILVTLSGIAIEVKLLQPENADSPMLVTPSGIETSVRLSHPKNMFTPIWAAHLGISMVDKLEQWQNMRSPTSVMPLGNVKFVNLSQPANTESPMIVTLSGMAIFVSSDVYKRQILQNTISESGLEVMSGDAIKALLTDATFSMRNNYGGDGDGTHTITFHGNGTVDASYTYEGAEYSMYEAWRMEGDSVRCV